mgnify:CR=1 FL=1
MKTFKQVISECCTDYANNKDTRFIGYSVSYGSRVYGTLDRVDSGQCIETPVAENLMLGLAMGMSLEGFRPVVCFERHDFLLLGLDALVNHVDKMPWISGDAFKFPIIVRAIVGSNEPLRAGPMHTQDYTTALSSMLKYTPVLEPKTERDFVQAWNVVGHSRSGAIVIIEHRDLYNKEIPAE